MLFLLGLQTVGEGERWRVRKRENERERGRQTDTVSRRKKEGDKADSLSHTA